MILLTINDIPVPWTPSRVTRFRHAYNPKYKEKEYAQWQIKSQWSKEPISAPTTLVFTFHMPIPSGTSKKKLEKMLKGEVRHDKRPDTTNLIKFAEDCLNGIVLVDDSQVYKIIAEKIYSLAPRTVIQVFPIDLNDGPNDLVNHEKEI